MSLLTSIPTSPNPAAICALSPSSENCYLAYPLPKPREDGAASDRRPAHAPPASLYTPVTSGDVLIYDTLTLKAVNVIEAHKSPLSCVALNHEGNLLATASETGTIIRVFSVPRGQKLFQFRRGTYPSTISSMSFNATSSLLCVSSTTDTIHIFRLQQPGPPSTAEVPRDRASRGRSYDSGNDSPSSNTGSPRSDVVETANPPPVNRRQSGSFSSILRRSSQIMGSRVAGVVGNYLPQTFNEMWEPQRDFAHIKIPRPPQKQGAGRSVVAMSSSSPQVMVVTSDGGFYVFNIDMEQGGEGYLVKQFSVLDIDDKLDSSSYGA